MLHIFKRSCNSHITLFSVTSQCVLRNSFANKTLEIYFKKRNHFKDGMTRLVINTRLFTTLKSVAILKIIECFFDLCILHFVVECASKSFELFHSLEDGFVRAQFSKQRPIQNIAKCKYLFPSILS